MYKIAAPVSELAQYNKNGKKIHHRYEIEDAIPWNERSLKTFGVVYIYEATASFIGIDGKTYVVPSDQPVLEHLQECGYVLAKNGKNFDGKENREDSLIFKEKNEDNPFLSSIIDKNLSPEIIDKINELENGRPYYNYNQSYAGVIRFGTSFGLFTARLQEVQELTLSERKIANISTYGRVNKSIDFEEYVQFVLQQHYLNEENFVCKKSI